MEEERGEGGERGREEERGGDKGGRVEGGR